jgi:hypothetical protein
VSVTILFFAALLAVPSSAPPEANDSGLAVIDLSAVHGVPESLASLLNEVVLSAVNATGRFSQVIGGSDLRELLDLEQQKQALGCDDNGCIAAIGGALGVPYLLSCNLGKVGGRYVFTAKLLAVEDAKVLARATTMFADEAALLDGVPVAVRAVVASVEVAGGKSPSTGSVAAPASVPTAAAAKPAPASRLPRLRPAAYSLLGAGTLVAAVGYAGYDWARGDFDSRNPPMAVDWVRLSQRQDVANVTVAVGGALGAAGAALWWWGR